MKRRSFSALAAECRMWVPDMPTQEDKDMLLKIAAEFDRLAVAQGHTGETDSEALPGWEIRGIKDVGQ